MKMKEIKERAPEVVKDSEVFILLARKKDKIITLFPEDKASQQKIFDMFCSIYELNPSFKAFVRDTIEAHDLYMKELAEKIFNQTHGGAEA